MSNQLSLSFELICLMDWIIKNGREKFQLIVKDAINSGIVDNLDLFFQQDPEKVSENLYNTVLDFVVFLEDVLGKELDKINEDIIPRDKVDDLILHLDNMALDPKTVWLSIHQARKNLKKVQGVEAGKMECKNTGEEAKNEIFNKILNNWEPGKDEVN